MVPHRQCTRHLVSAGPRVALLTALLLLAGAPAAGAQHVRGRLMDLETNEPIPGGILTLLDANRNDLTTSVSDDHGDWQLDVPEPGVYYVAAKRLGYRPWVSGPVDVGPDDELDSVFHLQPLPVTLDPLEVRARALERYLEYSGFFERQRGNFGHFVTPEDIERRQAARVTDLLTSIPGVNLVSAAGGVGPTQVQLRGSNLSQGGLCRPRLFVDGLMYSRGDARPVRLREGDETEQRMEDQLQRIDQAISLDDIGHPSTIAAIEVYRSASQVPVQFGGSSVETLCGVIVIWTRTGTMRVGRQ